MIETGEVITKSYSDRVRYIIVSWKIGDNLAEPWISWTFLSTDANFTVLSGLVLLLYLCHLVLKAFLTTLWKNKDIKKHQVRAKWRRKGGIYGGQRACRREVEEERRLLSVLKSFVPPVFCSLLGQHADTIQFRHLLCPDPLCEVCNRATADVKRLLSRECLEDAAPSVSLLASTAPVTESSLNGTSALLAPPPGDHMPGPLLQPSPPPPSVLLPILFTPLTNSLSPSPVDDSQQPEPVSPLYSTFPEEVCPPLHPLSLPETQPEHLPPTMPQSQSPHLTQHQSPNHLQSPLPIPPPSPLSQIRTSGECHHTAQIEAESPMPSKIHSVEWNVLQKELENVWGLPPVVQKSQEDFCPPAPQLPLLIHFSKAHVPISILPGDFPLSSELEKKLEHHLRKRIIQHRWGLPRRIHESLSLMNPPRETPETCESKSTYGLSWISLFRGDSSKDLKNFELSQPGSFHEGSSDMLRLEKGMGRDQGQSPENDLKGHLLSNPDNFSQKGLESASEKDLEGNMESLSGKNSSASGVSPHQKHLENALKVHLNKKFEEMSEGQIPGTVHSSWHFIKQALPFPDKSSSQIKPKNLSPLVDGEHCLNTSQDISFLSSSKQKMLEDHIKGFRMRMVWGLPPKVLESILIFQLKEDPSQFLSHSNTPSADLISGVDSKASVSKPLRGSSKILSGDQVGMTNAVPLLSHCLSAMSPVCKEGQGSLGQSPPDTIHMHEPKDETVSFSSRTERSQDKRMKNLDHFSTSKMSREIFRAEELCALPSHSRGTLISKESRKLDIQRESSPTRNENKSKGETTFTKTCLRSRVSVPKDPKSLNFKNQMSDDLMLKFVTGQSSQAQGCNTSFVSESMTSKALLTDAQGISSGDTAASQVLLAQLEDRGISMEHHDLQVPKDVLWKSQVKKFPSGSKKMSPLGPKARELGGGDAGLGTTQPRRSSHSAQDRAVEQMLERKASSIPSLKEQPPHESCFKKWMKHFLKWLCLTTASKQEESSLEKGSSLSSSVQSRRLDRSRRAFTEAEKMTTHNGKLREEKVGHRHGMDITCPQKSLSSPMKFGEKKQHKRDLKALAESVQGHPSKYIAPSFKVRSTKSCS
ncbi:spermatogenesis-associated protein 31D3-like [Cynocephalus volans]|uniref:spermatogenesis-associated protein 31D3-like n=1 Tax=Cynocephalus volans TaxID=110931 RepID=UPI002FCC10BE